MPVIERSIRIRAPIEAVWKVLVDVPGQPRWMRDMVAVQILDPGPLRVGTRGVGEIHMFGFRQRDPIVISVLEPPHHFELVHQGAFEGLGRFRLWPIDDGRATAVHWREELRPTAAAVPFAGPLFRLPLAGPPLERLSTHLMRLVDPVAAPIFHCIFRADLRRLRRLVEWGVASAPPSHPDKLHSRTAPQRGPTKLRSEMAKEIDPVCGMEVETETAQHMAEHGGRTYYFCARGCKLDFEEEPQRYLAAGYQPTGM